MEPASDREARWGMLLWLLGLVLIALVVAQRCAHRESPLPDPTGVIFDVPAGDAQSIHEHVVLLRTPGYLRVILTNPRRARGRLRIGPPDARNNPKQIDETYARDFEIDGAAHQVLRFPAFTVGARRIQLSLDVSAPCGVRIESRPGLRAGPG